MRINQITPEVVELAPRVLQPGRLYISPKYRAAVHLCCCGCGEKVVTPISPAEWQIELAQESATLYPSIGNGSMACRSHYWIRDNRVIWTTQLPEHRVKAVFARDQRDLQAMHSTPQALRDMKWNTPIQSTTESRRAGVRWSSWLRELWEWFTH
ncbi:DUF6527 family protein [Ralstonia pseudosolanacearum]|uniref:DUF6527 family protein n=1 Tax=Ralstonia pseudosolanacearum TaxID=1310165 RepID=UPI001F0C13BE|nr:DUF6527 family protein [Ralstonia pseudosolanacearum]